MVSHHWLVLLLKLLTKSSDTELRKPVWNYEAIATEKNNPINVMNSHILLWRQWQIKTRIVSSFGVSYRYPQLELVEVMEFQLSDFKFQLSNFKSWKMMLWKCCTQYLSTVGKLSSGNTTGKGQVSFNPKERQCQRMFKLPHNCTHLTLAK